MNIPVLEYEILHTNWKHQSAPTICGGRSTHIIPEIRKQGKTIIFWWPDNLGIHPRTSQWAEFARKSREAAIQWMQSNKQLCGDCNVFRFDIGEIENAL